MKTLLACFALAGLCGCVSLQRTPQASDLPNFAIVETIPGGGTFRGGQPNEAGWKRLAAMGVHNVIKLNEESEASDEGAWRAGMVVYYVPVNWEQQLGLERMPANFALSYESSIGGTYVHCQHGQDRTGLFIALWRLRHGWTKADAEKEMLEHGFHKALFGLWDYWEDVEAPSSR